ncbi:MAG TPA: adenylate/guanylate cyclase domain-containing protein, partial [Verrucomicrobiota bacterium]|nr:adenylate/guanylate cyclase domain-containing protein [Verrucomicrobiota bacterium]
PLSLANEPRRLYELVVTRIPGADTDRPLGALLLAFPAVLPAGGGGRTNGRPQFGPPPGNSGPAVRLGIWSDGELFARDDVFGAQDREGLSQALRSQLTSGAPSHGEMRLVLGGEPWRVLFEALMPTGSEVAGEIPYQLGVYSLAEPERQQAELRRQILGFGAGTMVAALVLSWILAHGLSVPIRELVTATAEVQRGNFRAKVAVRSGDELGQLAGAFNEMTEGLELKERYRTVLNSVADERVAKQLLEGGLALGGEERRVSVVFCDIRGFTAHTENMTPHEIVDMLNEHMTALTRVVKANHGVLDKYVGDLLMALFGAPLNRPEDAFDAARCALGLVTERAKLDQTSQHQLAIGVGVATGEVVAGCMGSVERLDYTVIGERVNLASRLCSLARPGQVVVDDQTRIALGRRAEVRPLEPVRLKGFSEPVQAFELLALRDETVVSTETEASA